MVIRKHQLIIYEFHHPASDNKGIISIVYELPNCPGRKGAELFTTQSQLLMTPRKKPFENIEGNGENAGNQHFLLFHNVFNPITDKNHFKYFDFVIWKCFNLDQFKSLLCGKELIHIHDAYSPCKILL